MPKKNKEFLKENLLQFLLNIHSADLISIVKGSKIDVYKTAKEFDQRLQEVYEFILTDFSIKGSYNDPTIVKKFDQFVNQMEKSKKLQKYKKTTSQEFTTSKLNPGKKI